MCMWLRRRDVQAWLDGQVEGWGLAHTQLNIPLRGEKNIKGQVDVLRGLEGLGFKEELYH